MVKLEHVNKYFNRRRKNEIHVINDTSLEFEKSGMVALLGPSGCGKTTLLNVIGGLDKVNKGRVFINGQRITKRRAGKIDKIRNLNIGYVFQNYNLVENMTVFDNVAIALKMVGVKDKKEIKEKVNYVLEKVGMYRYRNRYADMLSGGERQRVGIARAIVKNPSIVIADEPTGNLDSKNTLEVMNIIKSISEDKLVILVTHEENLAKFYASRIIRISDGKIISDEAGDTSGNLDYRIDNRIYLKDIKDHKRLRTDNYNIDFYNDGNEDVHLDVVVRNGNIYIRTKNDKDRIEIVDDNSNIELIDEKYRQITKEDREKNSFDLGRLETKGRRKYKSIFNPVTLVTNGFKTVFNYNVLKKILLVGFFVSAMFITYAMSNIFGVLNITDDEFVQADKSYISVIGKKIDVEDYLAYEKDDSIEYAIPGNGRISLNMPYDDYFQTQDSGASLSGSLSDAGKLSEKNLIYGRLPENSNEIIVDRMVVKAAKEFDDTMEQAGFGSMKKLLGEDIPVSNMHDLTIVGISDMQSPCIYTDRSLFINLLANTNSDDSEDEMIAYDEEMGTGATEFTGTYIDYNLMKDDVELKKGEWPSDNYEVLVNEKNSEEMKIGKEISEKINGHKLTVTGYYSDSFDSDYMLINSNTLKYNVIKSKSNITLCPKDKEASMAELTAAGVNVKDTYAESAKEYRKGMWDSIFSAIIMAAVVLAISFIEIFLIIRASFLSRIKEVGVYRAIGVKKGDIYRMFMGEILAITTMASLPGYLFMAYILHKIAGIGAYFGNMFLVSPVMLGSTIIIIYVLNFIVGLLPVFRVIRKTPAAILSRTDI